MKCMIVDDEEPAREGGGRRVTVLIPRGQAVAE